jgi:beta-lactamase superfamily II metal-dependent hydrolase
MGYEIDFLAVGDKSSGGDAIALRWGDLLGSRASQTVMVIDGGYTDNGQALVDHITTHYGTDMVDIVVSTHPDRDHITGLETVLEQLTVTTLLMHLPWNHSPALAESRKTAFTSLSFSEKLEKSLQETSDLEVIAQRRGVSIIEPFAGVKTNDGCFRVLGPSQEYYEELLPGIMSPDTSNQRSGLFVKAAEAVTKFLDEKLDVETLGDAGVTRPSNNSSVISLLEVDGHACLLTGDAGIPALERVASQLEAEGFVPGSLRFMQVPHHGSRRNVGTSLLNRLLGGKVKSEPHATAFVSAPKENPNAKHPSKKVTNAFRRRGYPVHATQGQARQHGHANPDRAGWITSTPLPFYHRVESDD